MKAETETRIVELQRELVAAAGERSAVETRLASLDRDIAEIDQEKHAAEHYAKAAWREARWLVAGVFAAYLFGGLVVAAGLYFLWAPLVARGRPLRLREEGEAERLGIGESAVVVEDAVWPGEVVWVRRRFLHLGEDGLSRHSRLLLSWRYPFGCWAAGLFRLIELRNGRNEGARRVLFADAVDPFAELVVVNVPEGASFVVRAGFVKGVIAGLERPPFVRRHWRLSRWQSWVSGQFAYVEFAGPCRLVVSCVSALQSETLALEGGRPGERRAPQAGLVGFSPLLELKPVRVAGFWRYCRRGARLFDVRLAGEGGFLLRDAQPGRRGRGAERFGGRLRKLVGL